MESERERVELGQEGKNLCMRIQEEATRQPRPSRRRREWRCVRVQRPPPPHHLPFFFVFFLCVCALIDALLLYFSVLRILSISLCLSLSLCFALGLCLSNEEDPSF